MRTLTIALVMLTLTGCKDSTGPPPEVEVRVTEHVTDSTGDTLAVLTFFARSYPPSRVEWSLEDETGKVGPLYGMEPKGRDVMVEVWVRSRATVNLVFRATPSGGRTKTLRLVRVSDF